MNEEKQQDSVRASDLLAMLARSFRRLWWLCLVLIVACSAVFGGYARLTYHPQYTASITFLVNIKGSAQGSAAYGSATASQIAKTFPYILTSGLLDSAVCADTGLTVLPAIRAASEEDTNLCTLSVTGSDPAQCDAVLQSVVAHYPDVAELVVGPTELVVMDQTGVPTRPSNPFSWRQPLMRGAVIGALLSLIVLYLSGRARATVTGRDDLQQVTSARYLGALPDVRMKKRSRNLQPLLDAEAANDRGYRESLRVLSMRTDKALRTSGYRTLLVSSAIPGEGKTTVSYQLALSFARHGRRVLLVDCDLRNPSVQKLAGRPVQAGLAEYLAGAAKPGQIVTALGKDKPDVIFAGRHAGTQTELLGSEAFRALMNTMRETYDFIVLDTPPCSLMTDAMEAGAAADCALLVVRQDFSSRASVVNSLAALDEYGVPVLGYALNACRRSGRSGYGYGYGYGYGDGYGYGYGYGYGERRGKNGAD